LAREIKADTTEILNDTSAIKEDTAQILAEIVRLQEQLPRDGNQRSAGFMLDRYLDNLTSYAKTVCDTYLDGSDGSRPISRAGSSGEDGPINENESALRVISPSLLKLYLENYDEGKEREAAVARLKALEPRVKSTRTEIEASKARERELQRQLEALDDEREKYDPSASAQATHDLNGQTKTDGTLHPAFQLSFGIIEAPASAIPCTETVEEFTEADSHAPNKFTDFLREREKQRKINWAEALRKDESI
jgi:hypothetical protein